MKNLKIGLICLALCAVAAPSMASSKGGQQDRGDRYEQRDRYDQHDRDRKHDKKPRPPVAVPEPGSLALLAAGMAGIAVMRRYRK